jgi:hypothetical protein
MSRSGSACAILPGEMKLRSVTALVGLPLLALPVALAHCGDGVAPHPYNPNGTPTAPTGTTSPDGAPGVFTYAPKGCPYTFTPSSTRPFTDYGLDDTTAAPAGGGATPVRLRVGLAGGTTKGQPDYADPSTTAAFLWETFAETTNAKLRFGTNPGALTTVQSGYVYASPPLLASDPTGYFHEVDVCGLTPGTTYYYQVGGGAAGSEVWSQTQQFTTVPSSGSITVGVYGDARDTVGTWKLVNERMRGAAPNLLLISGDIVDIGVDEGLFQEWLDNAWTELPDGGAAGPFITLGSFIMVPAPGNHENDSSQFFANFPIPGSGDYAKQYDSFDVGNTHFVLVDDNPVGTAPTSAAAAAILTWLDADLAAANADRAKHPFIVVISHRGIFSTSQHAVDADVLQVRSSFGPLFDKYHVDLVLNGHDHEYERSLPLNVGSPASGAPVIKATTSEGTTYVINAGAGAEPYAVGTYPSTYRSGAPTQLVSPYIGCYVLLTLSGTTLTLNAYGMKSSGGSVAGDTEIDSLVLGQ